VKELGGVIVGGIAIIAFTLLLSGNTSPEKAKANGEFDFERTEQSNPVSRTYIEATPEYNSAYMTRRSRMAYRQRRSRRYRGSDE
jgi:hypothetical protein